MISTCNHVLSRPWVIEVQIYTFALQLTLQQMWTQFIFKQNHQVCKST